MDTVQKNSLHTFSGKYHPEILLMDDVTAALDTNSEKIVKDIIDYFKLSVKKVIVIAYRLSTIANSDMILVLKKGKIIEFGNHTNQLSQKSKYFELWNKKSII